MQSAAASTRIFRFGLFEADATNNVLTRNGIRVKIQDQPFRVLLLLLEHPGEIVSRDQLRQQLWPEGTFVDFDGSLNVILKKLRAAIDDDSDNPRFVETVPRRGYRFIAPVKFAEPENSSGQVPPPNGHKDEAVQLLPAPSPEITKRKRSRFRPFALSLIAGAAALVAISVSAFIMFRSRSLKKNDGLQLAESSIAVMPFSNEGAGAEFDYLRFAIASDIVTDLTYARSISVRPLASTMHYAVTPVDPETAGRQMKVLYVISGDFVQENGKLKVTPELTRISDNRLIWRDTLSASPNELMRLHEDLAERLQNGVISTLGGTGIKGVIPVPHNPRAYDLYMRSVAVPRDPVPNKAAISALNEAIAEDPDYAPAWAELGWRAYLDASYSNGGEKLYQRSAEASARAAALDPNGTSNSITIKIEHGNVQEGFDEAQRLLARRPDASNAHFEMSYVYRYAGLLDEAARECNTSIAIDPGDYLFRSCSKVFIYKKDYPRAQLFLNLDGNSGWTVREQMQAALRQQNDELALAMGIIAIESGYKDSQLVVTKLEHKPAAVLSKIAAQAEADAIKQADSEESYEVAAMLSFAGQTDGAFRVLKNAIQRGYCATPQLDIDPLLANLRNQAEFQKIRSLSVACRQSFLDHVKSVQAKTTPSLN